MKRRRFLNLMGGARVLSWLLENQAPPNLSFAGESGTARVHLSEPASTPIAIHPNNPKYFVFRGKPLVLIAATEHYGSVINRRFDFVRYLHEAADKRQTVTRLFLLFRELQSARNPYSPLKAETPDFVAPYPRRGPGKAMDGEPLYNLDEWNPEYFRRLQHFLSTASALGIVVELTVFSNSYSNQVWALNPLRDKNNIQGIGGVEWQEYTSLKDEALVARQIAFARKIIQETSGYDNVYYEICNEPGGGLAGHVTPSEVDAWQEKIGGVLREELRTLNRPHLIAGQLAFTYTPHFSQGFDSAFSSPTLDTVNIHPLPDLVLGGRTYQLGNFMSKELQLAEFRDFFLAAYHARKPEISDEDNAASMYRDEVGWTIHRKRAWMAVMCGGHYDYIDFSIQAGQESGTENSRAKIRTWMRNLSEFIHSFDFIGARPVPDWIARQPPHLVSASLANGAEDFIAYFADGRELSDSTAGQPIRGELVFSLPEGAYKATTYSPVAGISSPASRLVGGQHVAFELPSFEHDIVLRVTRES